MHRNGAMYLRDYRNILAGALLSATGAFTALYALLHYSLGSLSRMGAGMFPMLLGILLAGLGMIILIPALGRTGSPLSAQVLPAIFVLSGAAAFAMLIGPFGLIPAIVALTVICGFADKKLSVLGSVLLSIVLCVIAVGVFRFALGLTIPVLRWPF